jgi:tRNA A37 threonylcarbamoyladenosine modification protein TsaB
MLTSLLEQAVGVCGVHYPEAGDLLPLARAQLRDGEAVTALEAAPVYLRGQSAWSK